MQRQKTNNMKDGFTSDIQFPLSAGNKECVLLTPVEPDGHGFHGRHPQKMTLKPDNHQSTGQITS